MNESELQLLGAAGRLADEWLRDLHQEIDGPDYTDFAELFAVQGGFLDSLDNRTLALLMGTISLRLQMNLS
ncbi:MAG: hypothetical protein AAFR97_08080 [Bacteroidota bacterium]